MDTEPATTAPAVSGDLCGLSRCRRPLPAQTGRGARYEYCPDRRWDYDGKTLSCRELGDAEKKLTAVFGRGPADAPFAAQLSATLSAAADPLEALRAAVASTHTYLTEQYTEAQERAEHAEAQALEAHGQARTAQAAAETARRSQAAAERKAADADERAGRTEREARKALDQAAADRQTAAVARGAVQQLEEENARLRAELGETSGKASAATARAERAEAQHRAAVEERDRLRAESEREQQEWAAERTRLAEQVERLSTDYAVRLDELQSAQAAALEGLREGYGAEIAGLNRSLGELQGQIADRERQLQEATARKEAGALAEEHARHTAAEALQLLDLGADPAKVRTRLALALRAPSDEARKAARVILDIGSALGVCNVAVDHHDGIIPRDQLSMTALNRLAKAGVTKQDELRRITDLGREALPLASRMSR
ncbi:hypothetical protein ABZ234_08260 [Nocardiopsis sp. NPDC006198]|uniref:hypothetical protein n=1 Tax=Nocardiopsis sp. NPDC006198 TaxID=3154472 RepID=UPI0033A2BFB2